MYITYMVIEPRLLVVGRSSFKMNVAAKVLYLVCLLGVLCQCLGQAVTLEDHSSYERPVLIADNIMPQNSIHGIREYMSEQAWEFSIKDEFYTFDSYSFQNNSRHDNYNNAPWQCVLSTTTFRESKSWLAMKAFLAEKRGKEFEVVNATGYILRRGDFTLYENRCADINNYRVVVFLNEYWPKDGYGQLTTHDELGRMQTAHPKHGRVVFVPCNMNFVLKPPTMTSSRALYVLVAMATPDMTTEEEGVEMLETDVTSEDFPEPELDQREIDVEKHITRRFSLPDGRTITVLDNVFTPAELRALRDHLAAKCTYMDQSTEGVGSSDNVQWITGFPVEVFTKSHFWRVSRQIVSHVSGNHGFHPYDVALNLIRMADHTLIHDDCEFGSDEFTLLLYLNQEWEVNKFGETAFFYDDYEPFVAVKPVYGRVVVFPCSILHSARPPNSRINGARYTFAVKMSPSLTTTGNRQVYDDLDTLAILAEDLKEFLSSEEVEEIKRVLSDPKNANVDTVLTKLGEKNREKILSYI